MHKQTPLECYLPLSITNIIHEHHPTLPSTLVPRSKNKSPLNLLPELPTHDPTRNKPSATKVPRQHGKVSHRVYRHDSAEENSLGDDPELDQVQPLVVSDVLPARVVLVQPIQHSLAARHDRARERDDDRLRRGVAPQDPLSPAALVLGRGTGAVGVGDVAGAGVHEVQIPRITGRLDDVHERLRGREAIVLVQGFPAVDVVRVDVDGVGRPDWRVQGAAGHGHRAQEAVEYILCFGSG